MKKKLYVISVIILSLFTIGMGNMKDTAPVTAPDTGTNYAVVMVDQSDVSMDLEKFSCGGRAFMSGKRGDAFLSIPFEEIRSVHFFLKDEVLTAKITLNDDTSVSLIVEKDRPCYGKFSHGFMKINMREIKSILFKGQEKE
ncbi:MAG: hypothetical protein LWX55_13815 [Deltaproteobacteria bacterium]|jgi:hypothetical protein|nr:hypothetical protein [Deltaproteobacteria bacterium]